MSAVHNFYTLPEALRLTCNLLNIISAGFATSALTLHQYRFKHDLNFWLNSAAAFLVLCQTLINTALIAQAQENVTYGIVPSGFSILRYAVFIAATAVFLSLLAVSISQWSVVRRRGQRGAAVNEQSQDAPISHSTLLTPHFSCIPGIPVIASFLMLPVMETWMGGAFPAACFASLAILLVSSVWLTLKIRGELMTSISSLSVKQAMDSLDTAVMFYRKSGYILMQNDKMQELMLKTAGRIFFNGRLYLEAIRNEEFGTKNEFIVRVADNEIPQSSLLTPDSRESEWLFTVRQIAAGRMYVTQLTAADVTEQSRVNLLLRDRQDELNTQQEQLKEWIENVEKIRRSEELLRIKTELHDAQNQKLTALLQYLRQGQWPPDDILETAGANLVTGIKEPGSASADPRAELSALIDGYEQAGVTIRLGGTLPDDSEIAHALVFILREAAANAVIHGYASEVQAKITNENHCSILCITDNSTLPLKEVREGSGISNMRRRLAAVGGKLEIAVDPRFTVTAVISSQ